MRKREERAGKTQRSATHKHTHTKKRKSPERKCQSQPLDSQRLGSTEFAPGCPPPRSPSPKGLIYSTRRSRRSGRSTGARRGAGDWATVTARAALGALHSPDPPTALRRNHQPPPPPFSSIPSIPSTTTTTTWPWSPQGLDRVLGLDITSSTGAETALELPVAE